MLWLHKSSGQWCKTHRGRRYYFGPDKDQATDRFLREWEYILRGEEPPRDDGGCNVHDAINLWLSDRRKDRDAGRIRPETWADYLKIGTFVIQSLGAVRPVAHLTPSDFAALRRAFAEEYTSSPTVLSRCVTVTRMAFRWGADEGKYPPVSVGAAFKVASKADKRAASRRRGRQVFTASEVRALLGASTGHLTACLWLGINGGYTQGELPLIRVEDIKGGAIDHLRNKTGAARFVPLWPETVAALAWHTAGRTSGPLLLDRRAQPLTRGAIIQAYAKLRKVVPVGVDGGFGKLRATFRTAADGCGDANAIRRVMGHEVGEGVESAYIKQIERERLDRVVARVREWLG
ncbi:MAG: tyrosine-type recombinase/integrase [Phycisphaerales bacterium JB063]